MILLLIIIGLNLNVDYVIKNGMKKGVNNMSAGGHGGYHRARVPAGSAAWLPAEQYRRCARPHARGHGGVHPDGGSSLLEADGSIPGAGMR